MSGFKPLAFGLASKAMDKLNGGDDTPQAAAPVAQVQAAALQNEAEDDRKKLELANANKAKGTSTASTAVRI